MFMVMLCLCLCYILDRFIYSGKHLLSVPTIARMSIVNLIWKQQCVFSLQYSVKWWLHYLPLPNINVDVDVVDKDKMKWHDSDDCIIYSISPDLVCHRIFCPSFHFHLKNALSFNLPSSQFMPFIDKVYLQQRNSKGYVKRTFRYFFWQF